MHKQTKHFYNVNAFDVKKTKATIFLKLSYSFFGILRVVDPFSLSCAICELPCYLTERQHC